MATVPDKAGIGTLDKSLVKHNRTTDADPNGTLTPEFSGEIVLDTTNKVLWQAQGTENNTWVVHKGDLEYEPAA